LKSYKILISNAWLTSYGGTESVVRDLSVGLLRRGHRPIVYSPVVGISGEAISRLGIPVIDDLRLLAEAPDIIHGHHFIQAAEAMLRFPETPALYVCHAWDFWVERPPKFPQIRLYGGVSEAVRDRLVHTEGIAPDNVAVFPNCVDLLRVPTRVNPLNGRLRKAVCFSEKGSHVPVIRAACEHLGISLDLLGGCGDRYVEYPERELVDYDLVFATGKSALEALCSGAAVVVCDNRGYAGPVTNANFDRFRNLNFALRLLVNRVSKQMIVDDLLRYDLPDAVSVAERARRECSMETQLDGFLAVYSDIIQGWPDARAKMSEEQLRTAIFDFLQEALPRKPLDGRWPWIAERDALISRVNGLEAETARLREIEADLAGKLDAERASEVERIRHLEHELQALRQSVSWRVTWPLRKLKELTRI
jgi:hypothetical protein